MNATTVDHVIASAASKGANVTVAVGRNNDYVRHHYCLECLDQPYIQGLWAAGRLLNIGISSLPCEACGSPD